MANTFKPAPVIAFGELLWDLLPSGRALGGAPANFGFRLFTLGFPVSVISRVGSDELGCEALQILSTAGLDTSGIQIDQNLPTGTVDVFLTKAGVPDFTINKHVAYDEILPVQKLIEVAAESSLICFGTLVQRAVASRRELYSLLEAAPQAVKFLDINLRKECYSQQTVSDSLKRADILKLNDDEVGILSGMLALQDTSISGFCAAVIDRFKLRACLVTLGKQGAFAQGQDGQKAYVPGHVVKVVDTVGSGDSFSAGFVSRYLRKQTLQECCSFGNALGALVAARSGAMARVAEEEIRAFLANPPERVVHPEFLRFN